MDKVIYSIPLPYAEWQFQNLNTLVELYHEFMAEEGYSPEDAPFEAFCRYMFKETKWRPREEITQMLNASK